MRNKIVLSVVFLILAIVASMVFMADMEQHATFSLSVKGILFILLIIVFVLVVFGLLLNNYFTKSSAKTQARINELIKYDSLTDLPSRSLFFSALKDKVEHAAAEQQFMSLIYLDIDHFKSVNDNFGHEVGDKLVQVLAKRLTTCLRDNDFIARIGGDAFAIILTELASLDIDDIIRRIQLTVGTPYGIDGKEVRITTSMGVARFPSDAETSLGLIKHAEIALYAAKEGGRNNCQYFHERLIRHRLQDAYIENALRFALERNEFFLMYQPQFEAGTKKLVGMEVLLRWQHPKLGLVPPDKFIALAEKTGLIASISEWVLTQSCRQYSHWLPEHKCDPAVTMSINLSPHQLLQANFANKIVGIVRGFGICPSNIHLEITENAVIANLDNAERILSQLTSKGFKIVIDDFGTGYSSINYLKRLPVSTVKIDRSFIIGILDNHNDAVIVKSTIEMAQGLNLEVVVEGVETEEQLAFIQNIGDVVVQGFIYSEPLPVNAMGDYIKQFLINDKT